MQTKISSSKTVLKLANTATDGTGDNVVTIIEAGEEDLKVDQILWASQGDNVATLGRLWVNNGKTTNHAENNSPLGNGKELPATTLSQTIPMPEQKSVLDLLLPAGHRIIATVGTTVAAGYHLTAIGGDYER